MSYFDTLIPRKQFQFTAASTGSSRSNRIRTVATNMARRAFRGWGGRPLNSAQRRRANTVRLNKRARLSTVNRRRTTTSRTGTLGGTNASVRTIYRKKSMPRSKKRAWRRFSKKVHAISEKELGLQTTLFNDTIIQSNGVSGQNTLTVGLYPFVNSAIGFLNDMNIIGTGDNTTDPTAVLGTTVDKNSSIMFQSAVMDLTIRNTSTIRQVSNNVEVDVTAPEAQIELDIYEISMRKDAADVGSTLTNLTDAFNAYDSPNIGNATLGIAISDRGASPFEMSPGLSRFGIKVLSKTKYFIPGSQTITYQMRDPKRRVFKYGDLSRTKSFNEPGTTKLLFFIYKLVPGFTLGTTVGTYKCGITVGSTRKYGYKVEGRSEPRERLYGGTYITTANQ